MQVYSMKEATEKIINSLKKHETAFYYIIHDKTTVLDGKNTKANYEYIKDHNLELYYLQTKGGVTILQEGNISFCIVDAREDIVAYKLRQVIDKLIVLLESKGITCSFDNNDLLVDEHKVCAFSSNYIEEYKWAFASFTFTLNIDLDLVEKVCNKPTVKIPKGLSEFGITQDDVLKFLEDFLKEIN